MSQIFNYIDYDNVLHVTDYNDEAILYKFSDVSFRTDISSYLNFYTPIGVLPNNKIISLTNKQISFLIHKLNHFLGDEYASDLKKTYNTIIIEKSDEQIIIEDGVFQFFDYESVNATGHSHDLMFYLLYFYKKHNLKEKLLVVESENKYYNSTLELIKKYFHVEYLFIKPNKSYFFKNFTCTRTYQNIFFHEVKKFINENLLVPIVNKYNNLDTKYYDNVIKIKYSNVDFINRLNTCFKKTQKLETFLKEQNIFDLNSIDDDEELKIYILNKANKIITNWGSTYHININYYLIDTNNKFISLIFHSNVMTERNFINNITSTRLKQDMPGWATGGFRDQIYNSFEFNGEIIDNIMNIDEYILKTTII
jgi:hypothetical protein